MSLQECVVAEGTSPPQEECGGPVKCPVKCPVGGGREEEEEEERRRREGGGGG